ncbi:Phenylalanine dehydrogenase [subsurface metagenome]
MMKPLNLENHEELGFLAYIIDRSRNFPGPDMKFPPEMANVLNKEYTINIGGAQNSIIGPSGIPTAHGVFQAIQEAIIFKYNSQDLTTRSILVQGLGAVGMHLAKLAIAAKMTVFVSDFNAQAIQDLMNEYPNANITEVPVDSVLSTQVDVLSPCAIGGIITHENIATLQIDLCASHNKISKW